MKTRKSCYTLLVGCSLLASSSAFAGTCDVGWNFPPDDQLECSIECAKAHTADVQYACEQAYAREYITKKADAPTRVGIYVCLFGDVVEQFNRKFDDRKGSQTSEDCKQLLTVGSHNLLKE